MLGACEDQFVREFHCRNVRTIPYADKFPLAKRFLFPIYTTYQKYGVYVSVCIFNYN